jgi:hypothetical protein
LTIRITCTTANHQDIQYCQNLDVAPHAYWVNGDKAVVLPMEKRFSAIFNAFTYIDFKQYV